MATAGLAVGADGLMIEVHPDPDRALSDGAQSLTPEHFDELMQEASALARAIGSPARRAPAGAGLTTARSMTAPHPADQPPVEQAPAARAADTPPPVTGTLEDDAFALDLPRFQGPLALLLHLIERRGWTSPRSRSSPSPSSTWRTSAPATASTSARWPRSSRWARGCCC